MISKSFFFHHVFLITFWTISLESVTESMNFMPTNSAVPILGQLFAAKCIQVLSNYQDFA